MSATKKSKHGSIVHVGSSSAIGTVTVDEGEEDLQHGQQHKHQHQHQHGRSTYISDVTPGGFLVDKNKNENGEGLGASLVLNNSANYDDDDGDTSDSSEAEMNELRNKIAVNTLLTQEAVIITPGGGDDGNNDNNIDDDINVDAAMYEAVVEMEKHEKRKANGIDGELKKEKDNFSSMLTDKLVGIDMIEDDIVNDMENEIQDPHGKNNNYQTPGSGLEFGNTPNGNDIVENDDGEGGVIVGMSTAGLNLDEEGEQ